MVIKKNNKIRIWLAVIGIIVGLLTSGTIGGWISSSVDKKVDYALLKDEVKDLREDFDDFKKEMGSGVNEILEILNEK